MENFKKHIIDADNNYKIGYWPENEFQKFIDENKPLYTAWLNEGNTPETVSFVPPAPQTLPTLEEKRLYVQRMIIDKQNNSYDSGVVFEGNIYPSDQQYREIMNTGSRAGQAALNAGETLSLSAYTISGTIEVLNENQMVDLLTTYDNYGIEIYNLFMTEMGILQTATSAQIDQYILSGAF